MNGGQSLTEDIQKKTEVVVEDGTKTVQNKGVGIGCLLERVRGILCKNGLEGMNMEVLDTKAKGDKKEKDKVVIEGMNNHKIGVDVVG